jgi:kumamolisin
MDEDRPSSTARARVSVSLPGSAIHVAPGARQVGTPSAGKIIHVSIYARRNPAEDRKANALPDRIGLQLPQARVSLTSKAFNSIYGADTRDLRRIKAWARRCRLKVVSSSVPHRRVIVKGPIADMQRAFGVRLHYYRQARMGRYIGRVGDIRVPPDLVPVIQGIYGLDRRHVGSSRSRKHPAPPISVDAADGVRLTDRWPGSFFPPQVAELYGFPPKLTGRGQSIAILAFNGGHRPHAYGGYSRRALRTYFERVLRSRMPTIIDVVVRGPGNDPGPDTTASARRGDVTSEVMLDLCVVGSVAPDATIYVHFSEFTTQGWIDAMNDIIAGRADISVISVSYGNPEHDPDGAWTVMGVRLVNELLQAAAAKGITVCCSAGDDGSSDQESAGAHVDFPASSPYALGVGGTTLELKGTAPGMIETVWNELRRKKGATGGGVSFVFPRPPYQRRVRLPHPRSLPRLNGRGVPDVAAIADPLTGVIVIHVDGRRLMPMGGTSVGAPLWSALVARLNEGLGARCGFLNPILYRRCAAGVLSDIRVGTNGAFRATRGWDACTGLGTPDGQALLNALRVRHRRTKREAR